MNLNFSEEDQKFKTEVRSFIQENLNKETAKRVEEEQKIPEDDMKKFMDDIQEVTDSFVKRLNSIQQEKEVEILDK